MTTDEIIDTFPPIPEEMKEEAKLLFTHYIFYTSYSDGSRECQCSYCGGEWSYQIKSDDPYEMLTDQKALTSHENEIYHGKHNDIVCCPFCDMKTILKNRRKYKNNQSNSFREEKEVIFIIPKGYETVYIRAFYINRSADLEKYEYNENTRYFIESGRAIAYKSTPVYSGEYLSNKYSPYYFRQCKNIIAPFANGGFPRRLESWYYIGVDSIEDTFLKYSQYNNDNINLNRLYSCDPPTQYWYDTEIYKLFCIYAIYPQIEILIKTNFTSIVDNAIFCNKYNKRYLNWKAKKINEFFGLNKTEIEILSKQKSSEQLSFLKYYKKLKKTINPPQVQEANWTFNIFSDDGNRDEFLNIITKHKISHERLCNYLNKQSSSMYNSFITYRDYLNMALELDYNLSDEVVLMPKKLKNAHDTVTKIYNEIKFMAKTKKYKKIYNKYVKIYAYENKEYVIRVPESMQEIIQEGQILHHCVGSYADRHIEGKTAILFLRRKCDPNEPYFTIEMHGENYRQIQGYKNSVKIDGTAKEFFDNFLEYVKHRNIKSAADQVLLMAAV